MVKTLSRAASAPGRLRDANTRAVLGRVWGGDVVTGSDLMRATGLSRSTVHDVCDQLIRRGWLRELDGRPSGSADRLGRPARRYRLAAEAGVVVGVDAGVRRIRSVAADLLGRPAGRWQAPLSATDPDERRRIVVQAVAEAAAVAGRAPEEVLVVTVGVPAPVDAAGRTVFRENPFWAAMNPDLLGHLRASGWRAVVENEVNLAAVAESVRGHGRGVRDVVTLVMEEGFGAGVVVDGRLLHGAHGAAGELRLLDHIEGVGSPAGLTALARDQARAALAGPQGAGSSLRHLNLEQLGAADVVLAAERGDPLATRIVADLSRRLTRVVAAVATVFDPSRVVLAGPVAEHAGPLAQAVTRHLPAYLDPPRPQVLVSTLGSDVISVGAVERALAQVREDVLSIVLPGHDAPVGR